MSWLIFLAIILIFISTFITHPDKNWEKVEQGYSDLA